MNKLIFCLSFIILLSSCKSLSKLGKSSSDMELEDRIESKIHGNKQQYYLADQMSVKVSGDIQQSFNAKLFIATGEFIFISANFLGLEIARVQISRDSLKIIKRFPKREYFFGSVAELQKITGINLDYNEIESFIITGLPRIISDNKKSIMKRFSETETDYIYSLQENNERFIKVYFSKNPFKEYKFEVSDSLNQLYIVGLLEEYLTYPVYPGVIKSSVRKNNKVTDVEISINRIENKIFNNTSFKINSNYDEMSF